MKNQVPFIDDKRLVRDKKAAVAKTPSASPARRSGKPATTARSPRSNSAQLSWRPTQDSQCLKIHLRGSPDLHLLPQWRQLLRDCQYLLPARLEVNMRDTGKKHLLLLALLSMLKEKQPNMILQPGSLELYQLLEWSGLAEQVTLRPPPPQP